LGPHQYPVSCESTQEADRSRGRYRCRRCLLKDCERSYRPRHPQCRFCSDACQRAAKKWRAWRAAERWRATERGKECRRAQSRRYRRLIALPLLTEAPCQAPEPTLEPPPVPESSPDEAREGQRPAPIPENFVVWPCARPGCYVLFGVPADWSPRRFCCDLCHKALRRVLDREARYQRRRRARVRPRARPVPKPRK
jgi:hypothetical protein